LTLSSRRNEYDQHRYDHRHVSDGVPDPKFADRDSAAIQVKLDELIRVSKANDAFMGLERLTDEELEDIEGKDDGRAKAVLEARQASKDAKHKLGVIEGDG